VYSGEPPRWATRTAADAYVIKLASEIEGLDPERQTVAELMARAGITSTGDWLDSPHGYELHITANGVSAWSLWQTLTAAITATDVWLAPVRQAAIKLLICDMDSTLITTESLDELAAHVGIGEQVAAITSRAMNGELDFVEALNERVGLLKNLDYSVVEQCVAQTRFNTGARELIAHARTHGARTILVSGGFTPFADFVGRQLGCDRIIANTLDIAGHALTGRVLEPIVTKDTKLEVLQQECRDMGITAEQCCTIGDGANDIPMLVAAGTGVAYRAKDVVLRATPHHLSHAPLDVLNGWLNWS
jgi:phosphoserine phosphatase